MPKNSKKAGKKGSKSKSSPVLISNPLETLLAGNESKEEKKKEDSEKSAKILISKEKSPEELLRGLDKAVLEDKVRLSIIKISKPLPIEAIENVLPSASPEEKTPLIRKVSQRQTIAYEENPNAQIQTAAQEENKRKRYQERTERPAQTIVQAPASKEESRPVAYSTRAMYGAIEEKKGRAYSIEEKSFQMANIIANKVPQPKIREANMFENRLMKQEDIHEEYSIDLEEQPAPKPKRRYPWEF